MSDEPVTTSEVTIERVERGLAVLALLERLDGSLEYLPIHTTLSLELVALRAREARR
jgi:hypothetical protein